MEYIMITLLAISLCTALAYTLANGVFRLHIQLKPLILCAGCSILITTVLPRIIGSHADLNVILIISVFLAIICAYLIACYHDSINNRSQQNGELQKDLLQPNPIDMIQPNNELLFQLGMADTTEQADSTDPNYCQQDNVAIKTMEEHFSKMNGDIDFEPTFNSLDDLLDYAFNQKEAGNFTQAFKAFRQALQLLPESDSSSFIIIELGNILKSKGEYEDAIKIFAEGRSRALLQQDFLLEQEFIDTIAYLRIIKNTLLSCGLGFIPYNQIPPNILNEIDAEFREWCIQTK